MNFRRKGKDKNRRIIGILVSISCTVLLVLLYLGFQIWENYKNHIMENQVNQMLLTSRSIGFNLGAFIKEYQSDLENMHLLIARNNEQDVEASWTEVEMYVTTHSLFVYDVLWEDDDGTLLKSTKGNRIVESYTEIAINENTSLYQSQLENQNIYLVLRKKLGNNQTLAIVLDSESYYNSMISNIQLGTNGYVMVKDYNGTILMHIHKQQLGIDVIEGRRALYPDLDFNSLDEMIKKQKMGQEGVDIYYSYWWDNPAIPRVKKVSAYSPVYIGENFLIVSAVIDYSDLYLPIQEGFSRLILVFLGMLFTILTILLYMANLILQKKRDTEEIAYLIELNHVLEELHRSEERLAHQQRLQIIGTMTGGIAHEFNNLLTPIMGYADLLLVELPKYSDMYDSANEIYEASAKAKEIILQISSLSRKNMETVYKNINISKMLERVIKMVASICPPNITLRKESHTNDICILGNTTQLNQVILNICVNAIHAIDHEDGEIFIQADTVAQKEIEEYHGLSVSKDWEQYVRIDISDNGCGMTSEVVKKIFEPFFTTKKNGKGTGLGLALVEQIITSHRGHIFVESQVGKGSIFHIYLPVSEQVNWTMVEKVEKEWKILIIDDNSKVLTMLKKSFKKANIQVTSCMDFHEARHLLNETAVDVLVAEEYIGEKRALDFCMSIQRQYPTLIKIIMIDRVNRELIEAKQREIIDEYIDKPVSVPAILNAMRIAGNT